MRNRFSFFVLVFFVMFPFARVIAFADTAWYLIKTENFDILFRKNIYKQAQRMANTLETIYDPMYKSFSDAPRKRSLLILDNQDAICNGIAFPGKMIFYTLPSQDDSNMDWLTHLALHELRHIVQFTAFFGKLLIPYQTIPLPWFFEGDAVAMETLLSNSGRGRLPSFSLLYRTNLLEGRSISYSAQILGSMKNSVPDYYKVGYFLTCYLRKTYGADLYKKITEHNGLPFKEISVRLKECTGKSLENIYEDMNKDLAQIWKKQLDGLEMTHLEYVDSFNSEKGVEYYFPQKINEKTCIAFKAGMDVTGYFVSIDENRIETKILEPKSNSPKYSGFCATNRYIVWTESMPDILWGSRGKSYSVIHVYDLNKKETTTINNQTRYAAASISPDEKKIVAVESDESYNHSLVIFDVETGKVIKKLQSADNQFFKHPHWSTDSKKVIAVAIKNNTASFVVADFDTDEIKNVLPYTDEHISHPIWHDDYIFYNSAFSGIDNIYAMNIKTSQRFQVTCRPYGAYNANIASGEKRIYFNDFTKDGMRIAHMPFDPKSWKELDKVERREMYYFDTLANQECNESILESVSTKEYSVYEYPIFRNAISNWSVSLPQSLILASKAKAGVVVSSSDLLDILLFKSGVEYDFKKSAIGLPFYMKYTGWYPILKVHAKYELPVKDEISKVIDTYISHGNSALAIKKLTRNSFGVSFTFPIMYFWGESVATIKPKVGMSLQYETLTKATWVPFEFKVSLDRKSKTGPRDINPSWSQNIVFDTVCIHPGSIIRGHRIACSGKLLFPGISKHHSFGLKVYWQSNTNIRLDDAKTASVIAYSELFADFFYSKNRTCICLEYALPLFYIDKAYKSLIVFKRFYTNLLFEYVYLRNLPIKLQYHPKSIGVEFMVDMGVPAIPFSAGIRPVYTIGKNENSESINNWGVSFVARMSLLKV